MAFRLILAVPAAMLGLAACTTPNGQPVELSQEAACLAHFENDPVERDRCRLDAAVRHDSVPDVSPQQLPIKTDELRQH